ncbi:MULTISPECIES: extracellular solute-binding protein [unclassified Streptomyces]|jgi:multiple sugar transport system substrate-binding protein|uniref:ABC transporter substrate-binding protein n=1 Tax=unclassified Streptomyces TaxID=2593676 RepID=UPI000F4F4760|nr:MULTISPECIES: extracellular solute-binding protein [unclassified Streptomyces]MDH6450408.1 multiple sugar transport system substrate-binding protein [Streptomyces sp. SAI-119]MDH6499048.1 multiple sugar transport system substrate-binding protein [Streptomyces sp. SAI-149]QUC62192.1 extracellular solute-binding protein [Streptomyces sp. A2-16]GLP65605.1 ABC transporter substrate-binding protein [Streptomyces sp. TUS-ST3]
MRDLSSSLPSPSRRGLLKGVGGAALLGAGIPLLSACGSSGSSSDPKTVSLGSNASDAVPKKAFAEIYAAFKKQSGITVDVNTKDHNTFQEQINSYLQGTPDDVFNWFAGYRMQFFAAKNLASPIDDVWGKIGDNFPDAMKKLSKGADGKYYFVPLYTYPWAIFYRKSVFQQHGYQVPTTWDQLVALSKQMKKDGLVPIAFGDKDAWPAMGTFDQINFRLNGYDFHVELMAGKAAWTDAKVKAVFDHWAELLPYHQDGFMGRTWQDAAQTLVSKKAGMYLLGSFVAQQFSNKADLDDLDFFAFPEINPAYGQDTVEAPTDGFMVSKAPKNKAGVTKLLEYLGTPEAEQIYLKADSSVVAASSKADTSSYTPLQKKAYEMISGAKSLTQFMDRDSRPDFTSTVMQPSLQKFLQNPKGVDSLLSSIERQKKTIFASS